MHILPRLLTIILAALCKLTKKKMINVSTFLNTVESMRQQTNHWKIGTKNEKRLLNILIVDEYVFWFWRDKENRFFFFSYVSRFERQVDVLNYNWIRVSFFFKSTENLWSDFIWVFKSRQSIGIVENIENSRKNGIIQYFTCLRQLFSLISLCSLKIVHIALTMEIALDLHVAYTGRTKALNFTDKYVIHTE